MFKFLVHYQYGTYSGTETVWADDEDEAIAKARARLRSHMTLSTAYQSWQAVRA